MKKNNNIDRRTSLKIGSLAALGLAIPNVSFAGQSTNRILKLTENDTVPEHFPNIPPEIIAEVVGKSHFDLDRVKELVEKRPELSRSVWEWRFGDFESAIGAASHVGRRDIAMYLMSKGARPTVFTFAMLGHFQVIKSIVEASKGIQEVTGPHGISLLDHAYAGRRMKDKMTQTEIEYVEKTIEYLESLGNAGGEKYIEETKQEQAKFLGDYKYGDGEKDGFTIALNMREKMALGPLGGFGGALYKIKDNLYTYNGAPSVNITFDIQGGKVKGLKLSDPEVTITAEKIS